GHHAAELRMHVDLRRDDVRENPRPVLDDGGGGLVARALEAEDLHPARIPPCHTQRLVCGVPISHSESIADRICSASAAWGRSSRYFCSAALAPSLSVTRRILPFVRQASALPGSYPSARSVTASAASVRLRSRSSSALSTSAAPPWGCWSSALSTSASATSGFDLRSLRADWTSSLYVGGARGFSDGSAALAGISMTSVRAAATGGSNRGGGIGLGAAGRGGSSGAGFADSSGTVTGALR